MWSDVNSEAMLTTRFACLFTPTLCLKYRVAGQLPKGEPLPPHLLEVVVGLVLGDAYIYRNKTENASLHIEQSIKSKDYLSDL